MESPINPAVWKFVFNATVGVVSAAALLSVWNQQRNMLSTMSGPFRQLNRASDDTEKEKAIQEILTQLQKDAVRRQSASRMSALRNGASLVKAARLAKSGSNVSLVSAAVKAIVRVFDANAEGRQRFYQLGGYKILLATLSEAHRQGHHELLEEVTSALKTLTRVPDEDIVLDTDVPVGTEGAKELAMLPATVKMLRIVDPSSGPLLLNALTGIYANVCTFKAGAINVGRGTDGVSGISFFLKLLDSQNRGVVENSLMTIRFMARSGVGLAEIAEETSVMRLTDQLRMSGDVAATNAILTIILIMMNSEEHGTTFLTNLSNSGAMNGLFEIWVRSPDRMLRGRAESLCRVLMRIGPAANTAAALFARYRSQIEERRHKDEQEEQRQAQQMMQNEFMQRMMMEQMGMA